MIKSGAMFMPDWLSQNVVSKTVSDPGLGSESSRSDHIYNKAKKELTAEDPTIGKWGYLNLASNLGSRPSR